MTASLGSAGSTSDSKGQATPASAPANPTQKSGQSTLDTFRASRSPTMPAASTRTQCLTLMYFVEDFLARLSRMPDEGLASPTPGVMSALRSHGLLEPKNHRFYSLRTCQAYLLTQKGQHLRPSSLRWMRLGTMRSGRCWTANVGYRKAGAVSTLSDILEERVPERYFLSMETQRKIGERAMAKLDRRASVKSPRANVADTGYTTLPGPPPH